LPYKFLEDFSIADVAFEAEGNNLEELFLSSALALTNTMVKDLDKIDIKVEKEIKIEDSSLEMLLFNFLQEIIFYKDAERLIFSHYEIKIEKNSDKYKLYCLAKGEELDMKKHELLVDVKAVTMHYYEVIFSEGKWKARIVLDV